MNFFEKYFIKPAETLEGYNIVNTLFYSILFILLSYIVYKSLEKLKVKIDEKFILSNVPFILFGILYRIQVDLKNFNPSILTVTPGPWIITFTLAFISLILSTKFLSSNYWKAHFLIGTSIVIFSLTTFKLPTFCVYLIIWFFLLSSVLLLLRYGKNYAVAFSGQLTDAVGSYFGIKRGFFEEHVVGRFIVQNLSPEAFLIFKLLVTFVIIFFIEKYCEDVNLKNFLYFVIFVLGFGPGSRNFFILC